MLISFSNVLKILKGFLERERESKRDPKERDKYREIDREEDIER